MFCARYRYDRQRLKRYKRIELIVEEAEWMPPPDPFTANAIVSVRVELAEVELQRKVKQAGGKWNPARRLWEIRYDQAVKLGLKGRIEKPKVSDNGNLPVSDNTNEFPVSETCLCYRKLKLAA